MQSKKVKITQVEISKIEEPKVEIRREIDVGKLEELAQSMKKIGLLQPILVKPSGDSYEIIAGHRRLLAAKRLGWKTIDAIIIETNEDRTLEARAHENIFRQNLSPVEEAELIDYLHRTKRMEITEIASFLGKSKIWVEERIDILAFDEEIKEALHKGEIKLAVARILMRVDDPSERHYLFECAKNNGATASTVTQWVYDYQSRKLATYQPGGERMPDIQHQTPLLPKQECWICKDMYSYDTLLHRWVCPDCLAKIEMARFNEDQKNT